MLDITGGHARQNKTILANKDQVLTLKVLITDIFYQIDKEATIFL